MQITFNSGLLEEAAIAAGDVGPHGKVNYSRIGRRAGVDTAIVSRAHRNLSVPDLTTLLRLGWAYNLTVEALISISGERSGQPALAA